MLNLTPLQSFMQKQKQGSVFVVAQRAIYKMYEMYGIP